MYTTYKCNEGLELTNSANGLRMGKTLSSAIRCNTLGGPTKPPRIDESAATNNPKINKNPIREIYIQK